jgi:cell division FtsZ-interacting protein ZapD
MDPKVKAKLDLIEARMRALNAELEPQMSFERFVNYFANVELWHLGDILKERGHKAQTGKDLDAERKRVFELVQNKEHWKNPIDATLDELSEADEKLLYDAVPFYTGSVPTITRYKNGRVRVRAAGYYRTVGA